MIYGIFVNVARDSYIWSPTKLPEKSMSNSEKPSQQKDENFDRFFADKKNAVAIDELVKLIETVKHGTVQVIIQDGQIVQIDKTEKIRLK